MSALTDLILCLLIAITTALVAVVYVNILTQPGQLLGGWSAWLHARAEQYIGAELTPPVEPVQVDELTYQLDVAAYQRELNTRLARSERAEYWLKPLLTCVYCVSGQFSFWVSVYLYWWYFNAFNVILSLLCAGVGIFLAGLFQVVQKKLFPL